MDYCTNIWIFIAFPVWLQGNISVSEEGIYPLLLSELVSLRNLSVKCQLRCNSTPTGRSQHTSGPINILVGSVSLVLLLSSSSSGVLPHCDSNFFSWDDHKTLHRLLIREKYNLLHPADWEKKAREDPPLVC